MTPSKLAIDIVLALDTTSANCYHSPEAYRTTLEGEPSSYPAFVCEDVHAKAHLVDNLMATYGVVSMMQITYRIESDDGKFTTKPGVLRLLTRPDRVEEAVRSWCDEFCPEWITYIKPRLEICHFEYVRDRFEHIHD